jgi:hypothetical protein
MGGALPHPAAGPVQHSTHKMAVAQLVVVLAALALAVAPPVTTAAAVVPPPLSPAAANGAATRVHVVFACHLVSEAAPHTAHARLLTPGS